MSPLAEAIEERLGNTYWRLSVETSLAAKAGVEIIRAMLDLHSDAGDGWCSECSFRYPCATVGRIAQHLEVEV